jgi:hypothetical protein
MPNHRRARIGIGRTFAREGEETFELGPEDEAALLAAIAEAERGESVSAAEILQKIGRG